MKAWIAALVLMGAVGQETAPSSVPPAGAGVPVWLSLETTLGTIGVEIQTN